jgi:hypothetical protein
MYNKMTVESVFILADKCENDPTFSVYEKHMIREALIMTIKNVLQRWTSQIPEEKLKLYGERLRRPVDYINNRLFQLDVVWTRAKEVSIRYTTDGKVDMYIAITPKLILVKDDKFQMREAAFPVSWAA